MIYVICPHSCEEHSRQESVPPSAPATTEPDVILKGDERDETLIVEERLFACLDALDCLQHLARLAQQENGIPQFSSLFRFARTTNQFARAMAKHLKAIQRVLPVSATDLRAPAAPARKEPV